MNKKPFELRPDTVIQVPESKPQQKQNKTQNNQYSNAKCIWAQGMKIKQREAKKKKKNINVNLS